MISVVTAVRPDHGRFLADAYESLVPQDVEWEWLVQFDGREVPVFDAFAADARVSVAANGRPHGPAITRNRALTRSRGRFVQTLDADDMLLPGALAALAEPLERGVFAFSFGRSVDLHPDGRLVHRREDVLEPGVVPPGAIEASWRELGIPVDGRRCMWRRESLLAYGGWGGLYGTEHTHVMIAAAVSNEAYYVDRDVTLYRRHDGQTIASDYFHENRQLEWDLVHARAAALRALRGIPTPPGWEVPPRVPERALAFAEADGGRPAKRG